MAKRFAVTRYLKDALAGISPAIFRPMQLALSLVMLTLSVLFFAELLGFGKDPHDSLRKSRTAMAESLAIQLSVLTKAGDFKAVNDTVSEYVLRNEDVRAAALVRRDGSVLAKHGDIDVLDNRVLSYVFVHLSIPILENGQNWGDVQVVYEPGGIITRQINWYLFVGVLSFVGFSLFLGKVLNQLDPGRVVPERVETAFDLFSAGVMILDNKLRVVLANQSVSNLLCENSGGLTGSRIDDWRWNGNDDWQAPWATTLHSGLAVSDTRATLKDSEGIEHLVSISCTAVGAGSETRGVLVTLDNISELEQRKNKLSDAMLELRRSHEAINDQDKELELLTTTDLLTGLANRRTLMLYLDREYDNSVSGDSTYSCILCDIDSFRKINDSVGYTAGDEVIRAVASAMQRSCRDIDLVGRFSGVEFLIILPGLNASEAFRIAEKIRIAVLTTGSRSTLNISGLSSSIGVAEFDETMNSASDILEAATKALNAAREIGGNRVEVHGKEAHATRSVDENSSMYLSREDVLKARMMELETLLEERDRSLEVLSNYDSLTGTPMRSLFLQHVDAEIKRAARLGSSLGVMSIELRDLDRIISSFGHAATDTIIVQFVKRVQSCLRSTDVVSELTAEHSLSRMTSNEYAVLLSDMDEPDHAMIVVTRVKRMLLKPFELSGDSVYIGANIGIAVAEADTRDPMIIIRQASDARVEASKKPDKVSHSFASAQLNDKSHDYIRLESELHRALDNGDLETWFQPKYDLKERRVVGMEALVRWRHETRGFVSPDVFVAVAEANGLIDRLSDFVLESTLEQIRLWESMGFGGLRISVNVSPIQLRAKSLVDNIHAALKRIGVSGESLEIELTETSVLENPDEARATLERLRAIGISVSMDDFGTGYTSLALLSSMPLDTLKIDRSFIVDMANGERSRSLVKSIIKMSHTLGLKVVAEGVETNEELELLSDYDCDQIQGYIISRPQTAEDTTAFLVKQRTVETVRRRA